MRLSTPAPPHDLSPELKKAIDVLIVACVKGACSNTGMEQADFLLEIASHGYLLISNGGPFDSGTNDHEAELVKTIDWAIAEDNRQCSPYYQKLNVEKIATMDGSCGGGMEHYAAVDPRVDTAVALNSGIAIFGDRSVITRSSIPQLPFLMKTKAMRPMSQVCSSTTRSTTCRCIMQTTR